LRLVDDTPGLTSDGATSDCVALAVHGFLPEKATLVVSGINPYANIGHDITYSDLRREGRNRMEHKALAMGQIQ